MSRKYWVVTLLIIAIVFLSLSFLQQSAQAGTPPVRSIEQLPAALATAQVVIKYDSPDPSLSEQSVSVGVNVPNPLMCGGQVIVSNGTYTCSILIKQYPDHCKTSGVCGLRFPEKPGSYVITATYRFIEKGTDTEPHRVVRHLRR